MKYQPLVSVIIPTHNTASTLREALESVLSQTYIQVEIIVVDYQSTDNTREIVRSFPSVRFYSEAEKGVYQAMNSGIAQANGEWLYFLGSDDELYNEFVLQNILQFINESPAGFVYGNVLIKGHVQWAKNKQVYDGIFDIKKLLTKNICHQSIFYKTYSLFVSKN
jgi:glycosyltransferase involved in cell wall biosynthesis